VATDLFVADVVYLCLSILPAALLLAVVPLSGLEVAGRQAV